MTEPDFSDVFATENTDCGVDQELTASAKEEAKDAAGRGAKPEGETKRDVTAPEEQKTENETKKDGQTKEENAKYAAARRKAERERDRMIDKARQDARAEAEREMDQLIAASHMVNPYTNTPIETKADFLAWQKKFESENDGILKNKLFQAGIDESEMERLIENHPAVKEAKSSLEKLRAAKENAETERIKSTMDQELAKIRQWDDSVKNLADITGAENYEVIYEKVKRGYSLSDAFYIANLEQMNRQTASKAEQSVLNHLRSKEHLAGTKMRGAGDITVPQAVMSEFKRLMPQASSEEIRHFYRKDLAQLKK
ncbi:MAG TPA: hypothetical protein PKD52_01070 [Clostridiales bacterium]|nr:hypothetical protein [Clostridiales bacterium]